MLVDFGESIGKYSFVLDWILLGSRGNLVIGNINKFYLYDRRNEVKFSYNW